MVEGVADDFLEAAKAEKRGPACSVGAMLRYMDPALRAKVEQALAWADDASNVDYNFASVSKALKAKELGNMTAQTISRHWRGECSNCAYPRPSKPPWDKPPTTTPVDRKGVSV